MKAVIFSSVLFSITGAFAQSAATVSCGTSFDRCLSDVEGLKATTCPQFQGSSPAFYNECLCRFQYNREMCWNNCVGPDALNANVQNERSAEKAAAVSLCRAVNIDISKPLPPASWDKAPALPATPTNPVKPGTPTGSSEKSTGEAAKTKESKKEGSDASNAFLSSVAAVGVMVAMLW